MKIKLSELKKVIKEEVGEFNPPESDYTEAGDPKEMLAVYEALDDIKEASERFLDALQAHDDPGATAKAVRILKAAQADLEVILEKVSWYYAD